MAKAKTAVPVNRRALITRINRALFTHDQQVFIARGDTAIAAVGKFRSRDDRRNFVVQRDIDFEDYARKLGVLADYEKLAE
jgi:hypothetical protein